MSAETPIIPFVFDLLKLVNVHLSGKRFGIEDDEWKGIPKNQLVFIGQNLEQEKLRELLENCVG